MGDLEDAFDQVLRKLAKYIAAELRSADDGWVAQAGSPLGNRRDCAAVKRRMARGEPGATVVGKKHLLSREALDDELMGRGGSVKAEAPHVEEDVGQRLRRKWGTERRSTPRRGA